MNRIFFSLILSGILISCGSSDKKVQLEKLKEQKSELNEKISNLEKAIAAEGGPAETGKIKDVGILVLLSQDFKHFIEVQGRVDGDENINVSSKIAGVVSRIFVH